MRIFIILNDQEHIVLNVDPTDKILFLKAKIEELKDISCKMQKLTYQGRLLHNDNTLENYSIGADSALILNEPSKNIRIFVITIQGYTLTFDLNSESTIKDLKDAISRSQGILNDQTKLLFGGKQLYDENTLDDYGIVNDSKVHMALCLRGDKPVIYLYPDKDNFYVNVNISMKKEDGEITSRYPVIKKDDNCTWKIKANKNGEIIYRYGKKSMREHFFISKKRMF